MVRIKTDPADVEPGCVDNDRPKNKGWVSLVSIGFNVEHASTRCLYRIWNYNDEAGFSQVLHLDIPHSLLPGSESGHLLVTGGLYMAGLSSDTDQSPTEYNR